MDLIDVNGQSYIESQDLTPLALRSRWPGYEDGANDHDLIGLEYKSVIDSRR